MTRSRAATVTHAPCSSGSRSRSRPRKTTRAGDARGARDGEHGRSRRRSACSRGMLRDGDDRASEVKERLSTLHHHREIGDWEAARNDVEHRLGWIAMDAGGTAESDEHVRRRACERVTGGRAGHHHRRGVVMNATEAASGEGDDVEVLVASVKERGFVTSGEIFAALPTPRARDRRARRDLHRDPASAASRSSTRSPRSSSAKTSDARWRHVDRARVRTASTFASSVAAPAS